MFKVFCEVELIPPDELGLMGEKSLLQAAAVVQGKDRCLGLNNQLVMIIFIFRNWFIVILVAVHLTSEPLAVNLIVVLYRFLICLGVQKIWVFGSRYLVIFMTMTSLAGFWEEKKLKYIISSLTCIEYIISSLTCIEYIIS